MPWYALYTKPRNEKKVADGLSRLGIEVYCPMVEQVRVWSDRKKKVSLPLIPSYVFVRLEAQEREQVFAVPGIVRYLYWLGKAAEITEQEISVLKQSLNQTVQKYEVIGYRPGDRINIPSGPFMGKEAQIKEVSDKKLQLVLADLGLQVILHLE
jgi:transcriptional antiterminator RfaH